MSGAGHIMVQFGAVEQARTDVSQTANSLNQQLGDLKAYLQPLVASWTGAAATDYQAKQAQWDQAQQNLNDILAQISLALGRAHDGYQGTEMRNRQMWA
ncbi:MAG: WXG100 family type VII secretion target [Carbonactinosporaceae bacterium]